MKKVLVFLIPVFIFVLPVFFVRASENVTSVLVEDFNELWTYTASENLDKEKAKITIVDAGANNDLLYPEESQGRPKKSLGFKCGFYNQGFNWITFFPPKPIVLPGKAKKIQLWVMGMKYRYNLEIWLEDYLGMAHKIDMGSIYFSGWKSMTREIPWYVPQQESSYPMDRPLKITKIILRADPDERCDRFYIYLDQIRIITDIYEEPFDGLDLIKKSGW